ncbi:MFS transporter [Oceanobacillus oncorhynchi subsp. incaldanensis]|uniref:MFS transporter n=1 Tax=Oceanobacillus aidingensis TaxID=645964 RepID=A0ABV9K2T6_9BACI|nr:MFS transporter [Oceanobacillus oncorhynchi]MDM8099802.1 MFS transporter [Oceanobacillus oncorhynchi]GIO20441.1 MFS transporter [Oceanobacillus oncorhynchi subsp. incaldanensis]
MESNKAKHSTRYEYWVVGLMFMAWGFIFLDRTALSHVTPSLVEELGLSNGQIGQINMWQTIGYAVAGPFIAILSDKTGKRKSFLVAAMITTAIFSILSAFANSYPLLLAVRLLLGMSEGPILPLAMAMVASVSLPGGFGRNAGIVNAGVAIIALTIGPIIVTQIISATNWHWAFIIVSIPSLVLALLVWKFTAEVEPAVQNNKTNIKKSEKSFSQIMKYRNVVVCLFIAIFCMGSYWILISFAPLYLTSVGQYSLENMGFIMSLMGLVCIFTAVIIPLVSDFFGRKPALILFALLAGLAPFGLFLFPSIWAGPLLFILFGGLMGSIAPIYMSIIPEETVPPHLYATTSALIIGVGEIVGAFIVGGSGVISNTLGLSFVMIVAAGTAVMMALIGFALIETNSRKIKHESSEKVVAESK